VSADRKRLIFSVLRAVLGFGLAALLIHLTLKSTKTSVGTLCHEILNGNRPLLLTALALYGFVVGITVRRWQMLLAVQGVHISFPQAARLTMIGVFFNLAIPGAVSGDLVKMGYVAKYAKSKAAEAILTIMLDRVLGLVGLFVLASVVLVLSLPVLASLPPEFRMLRWAAFVIGLGSVGGILFLAAVEWREKWIGLPGVAGVLEWCGRTAPAAVTRVVLRFVNALELYRNARLTVLKAILLSVLVHFSMGMCLFTIARAEGEPHLRAMDYVLVMQVANSVGAIPITPGGFGMRDATTAKFLEALGAAQEKRGIIPVTLTMVFVAWGLVGAVVFIVSPGLRTVAAHPSPGDDTVTPPPGAVT